MTASMCQAGSAIIHRGERPHHQSQNRHKAGARAELETFAKQMGNSLADLIGVGVTATKAPAMAKYRHPENAAFSWSGRSQKPRWFANQRNPGKDVSELAI